VYKETMPERMSPELAAEGEALCRARHLPLKIIFISLLNYYRYWVFSNI
jgi:hypothetical protein